MVTVVRESIHENSRRIWGTFKLSDGTTTKFEQTKRNADNEIGWFQWGNTTDNLCITVDRVEKKVSEWLEKHE